MKKLLVMVCLCAMAVCANAQKITVWYGANMAKVSGDLKGDSELKFLNLGATYTAPIADQFDWSVGAAYVTKGCKEWDPSLIQIDANAHYNFFADDDMKVGVLAGPYIGYMINDDDMEDGENGVKVKKLDYGIGVGVQGMYKQFSLKVGYEFGLANFIDVSDVSAKMNGLYFRLGYSF